MVVVGVATTVVVVVVVGVDSTVVVVVVVRVDSTVVMVVVGGNTVAVVVVTVDEGPESPVRPVRACGEIAAAGTTAGSVPGGTDGDAAALVDGTDVLLFSGPVGGGSVA
jgi:hypothetical protein